MSMFDSIEVLSSDYSFRHERPHFILKCAVDTTRLSRGVLQRIPYEGRQSKGCMSRNVARRQIATRSSYRRPNRAVGVREERRIGASQCRQAGAGRFRGRCAARASDRARRRLRPPSNSRQRHGAAPLPPRPRASAAHIAEDFEIERATLSASSGLIREGRVLSRTRPSNPSSRKRSCQRQTQVLDLAVRRMISFVPTPSAVNSTISALQTCFCGALRSCTTALSRRISADETERDFPCAHRADLHAEPASGIPARAQMLGSIH